MAEGRGPHGPGATLHPGRRLGVALLTTALALVLLLTTPGSVNGETEPPVVEVGHDPFSPAPGQSFNMSLTLDPDFEVNWTKLFVCTVTLGYCAAPLPADPVEGRNDTYGNATPIVPIEGHVLGYRFLVEGTDGTLYKYPTETTAYPGLELVVLLDSYYFKVQVQGNYTDGDRDPDSTTATTPGVTGPVLGAGLLVAVLVHHRRRPPVLHFQLESLR